MRPLARDSSLADVAFQLTVALFSSRPNSLDPPRFSNQPQIQKADGTVTITNDGATILDLIEVLHPAAKMVRLCVRVYSLV